MQPFWKRHYVGLRTLASCLTRAARFTFLQEVADDVATIVNDLAGVDGAIEEMLGAWLRLFNRKRAEATV